MHVDIDSRHDESAKAVRQSFVISAIVVEGGLLLVAVAIGCFMRDPPWTRAKMTFESIGIGVTATVPLLGLLAFVYVARTKSLVGFRQMIEEILGKSLAACRSFELSAIALLAGVSEEFLFRGVLEPSLSGWGPIIGLIATNIVFGLCHAVTPIYFVYAACVGVYLSLSMNWTAEPNLVTPICCHALYDLVAFIVVRNAFLKRSLRTS